MAELNINGLGVALVTPFKQDLSIDYEALKNIINHIVAGGCDYIVALGTTAETPTLSLEEKIILADFIRETVAGRIPLVIGIGGNNTKAVCDDIKSRDLKGYSAILSVTPYYNKPSQEGLFRHYMTIAEASSLPIILYNVPKRTGVNISPDTVVRLISNSSNIKAIKEASDNFQQWKDLIEKTPDDFFVISGDDASIHPLMSLGANGVISVMANAYPSEVRKLVSLCEAKCHDKASELQDNFKSIISPLFEEGNPAGIKFALSYLGMIQNVLRLPLVPISESTAQKIKLADEFLRNNYND